MPDYNGKAAKDQNSRVNALWDRDSDLWEAYTDAMQQEEDFLEGDRYDDPSGEYNRDRRLVQVIGQETQDTIRHTVAKITEKARSIEPRPIDQIDDADTGEVAGSMVEMELANPWKGFGRERYMALQTACEKRLGVVRMDWVPKLGPFGEIIYSWHDPSQVRWDAAWHPHHPMCEWLCFQYRLDVDYIHRTYKGSDWVKPDYEALASSHGRTGRPLGRSGNPPHSFQTEDDNKATLRFCYFKNDTTKKEKPEEMTEDVLDPEQRYLVCAAKCGYRSPTQSVLRSQDKIEEELPEGIPGACPTCQGDLERIDAKDTDYYTLQFRKGKRLVIAAPWSTSPTNKPVFDGAWPIPDARSFPAYFVIRYVKPGKPMGKSDVTLMWNQQLAFDQLRTMGLQRIYEHRNYWVMPRDGIYNAAGKRYQFREDDKNVMYRDASKAQFGPLDIEAINGMGLDPMYPTIHQFTEQSLTRYRGMADQGPVEDRSVKSGVALQTENAIGEVPLEDFRRRDNEELGMFYGVVWDYIRHTYTPERLARLNIEGVDVLANLSGDDMPNYDFVISDTPDFTGMEEAKAKAFETLFTVLEKAKMLMLDPVATLRAFAKWNNVPRTVLRDFEEMIGQAEEQAVKEIENAPEGTLPGEMDPLAEMAGLGAQPQPQPAGA